MLELGRIYEEDCRETMARIPSGSIDLVVTDPPYGVDYTGGHFHSGNVNIKRERERLEADTENVYGWLFPELYRILKVGGGGAYVFYAGSLSHYVYPPAPFKKFQMLVWGKSNAKYAAMMARYKHNFEPFVWLQKPPTKWRGDSCQTSLWWMDRDAQNEYHPTQKPVKLIARMIANSSDAGDIVYDPFIGAGSTALACEQLGRQWLGSEIEPKYVAIANKRLSEYRSQLKLAV